MFCNKLTFRHSVKDDQALVRKVEETAFGRKAEANLVEQLVPAPETTLSLIAQCDDKIVGHVLLTEISAPVKALALAPLAVMPQYRELQIGSQLVRYAIEESRKAGFKAIFVLGDVFYYERFGFSGKKADPFKIEWQCDNFMALELLPGSLKGKSGKLSYPEAFYRL